VGSAAAAALAPLPEVARIVRLYRERYTGFNATHFHEVAQREHGVTYAYTFVKQLLQAAKLLPTRRPRGRSERLNRTFQDRLVNELRVAGISTAPAASRYLREHFLPAYDTRFAHPPADPAPAFVPLGRVDITHILCHEDERTVAQDNTVTLEGVRLQIDKQPGRRTCAGLRVLVRRHLDGLHCVWFGARCFGHYDACGRRRPIAAAPRASRVLTPLPPLPRTPCPRRDRRS
jgi:hypothetical protein